jgi:HAE1 family hydrophobic/amphiphilic exporter-1
VMGMAVFSGMLIATILGVCLIPVLYVAVEKLTGGGKQAPATEPEEPIPPLEAAAGEEGA